MRVFAATFMTETNTFSPFLTGMQNFESSHLVRGGLIQSKRGAAGGYMLARPADAISFCDVIEAVEGPIAVNACMEHASGCDQIPRCTMIGVWNEVQRSVTEVLSRTTIAALRQPACRDLIGASSLSSAA